MSDRFQPLSASRLAGWMADELLANGSLFGIPRELFFRPEASNRFAVTLYGRRLETPIGVAAGPHSQLAQNIVVAWLCGARLMELKTVQTLDRLDIPKPCIDMQDVGYNVEWSQELVIEDSVEQYCCAWVLIHALHRHLGLPGELPGVCFNLSVGYDLAGIKQDNLQWFLEQMTGGGGAIIERQLGQVARCFPELRDRPIPTVISDNVTLSTMHGCPPEEIGQIATYLLRERGLHTNVKLNPTLLGAERLRHLLHDRLGYHAVRVPDSAFAKDLQLADALDLIRELQRTAAATGLQLGLKLSNTLQVENHRRVLPTDQQQEMYLSGRPLLGLTVNLAKLLGDELARVSATLPMLSYAGGADAGNVADLLAAGMSTVTSCSDLLRPGGYLRLGEYLRSIGETMDSLAADSIPELVARSAPAGSQHPARDALARMAEAVLADPAVQCLTYQRSTTKTDRPLGHFDCIAAPCTEICPVGQQVPGYLRAVRDGDLAGAAEIVCADNPLPMILGRACNHACEQVCTRTHSEHPVAIRELKRFIMDQAAGTPALEPYPLREGPRVAVIGAGPCGLAAARELHLHGLPVTVFEARRHPGGMVSGTIPGYRADEAAVRRDLEAVTNLGVTVQYGQTVGRDLGLDDIRALGFSYLVIAVGAQQGKRLDLDGEELEQVIDGLAFLRRVKAGEPPVLSGRVGVIGGGDVAADCARTARRLTAGPVQLIYRRTVAQMPARREELQGLQEEGIGIVELASPKQLLSDEGRLVGLRCARMQLGPEDSSGRRRPIEVPGSELEIPIDHLLVAIGQEPAFDFLGSQPVQRSAAGYLQIDPLTMETSVPGLYAGGDAVQEGPATIVKACGDGRRIAEAILNREGIPVRDTRATPEQLGRDGVVRLLRQRAQRPRRIPVPQLAADRRDNFAEVVQTLSPDAAVREASRCLECDRMCSTCVTVCPNRALFTYPTLAVDLQLTKLRADAGAHVIEPGERFRVGQELQVAVLTAFCNECGNCATFCPTSGRPYRDKPRLSFDPHELEEGQPGTFLLLQEDGRPAIATTIDGANHRCVLADGGTIAYQAPDLTVTLDAETYAVLRVDRAKGCGEREWSLTPCLTMATLLTGLSQGSPWLLHRAAP